MAKIIDVPGMGHVEFPDSMSDTDIVSAIQRNRPDPMSALFERPNTLEAKLAFGSKPTETFPQYAGRAVKEMAIPMATTAAGTATGGIPGAMAGSALGETINQALGVYGKSVIPEANTPDFGRIGFATVTPAIIPAIGKIAEGAKWIGGKTADLAKRTIEPLTKSGHVNIYARSQAEMAGNDPRILEAAARAAEQAKTYVSGSVPTAGQAIADANIRGATGLIAHELALSKHKGLSPFYQERIGGQETARSAAMRTIAKTPAALQAALDKRQTVTEPLYDLAEKIVVKSDDTLGSLMDRPSMEKVLRRAAELAKEKGDTFQIGKNLPARTVTSPIVSASGLPITKDLQAEFAKYPTKSLHYMKMALDDLTDNPERFGIGANEVAAIRGTRKEFVNWLVDKNKPYGVARDTYRQLSDEPNRMQVGQYLQGKLDSPLETISGASIPQSERANLLAQAVKDAPRTIKNSMGRSLNFERLDQVLTPNEVNTVENIVKDLARVEATRKLGAGTSLNMADTIPGDVGAHIPNLLYRPTMLANAVLRAMGRNAEQEIGKMAMGKALDTGAYAQSLRLAIPYAQATQGVSAPSRYESIIQELMKRQAPFAAGAATQIQP